jgi:pyruvate dehydrogenase E1 component alpha subunit
MIQPPLSRMPADLSPETLWAMFETMLKIRAYDERALKLQRSGRIGFCVTSRGEEGAQAATAAALNAEDWIFPSYRQVGCVMHRGLGFGPLVAQLFGNGHDRIQGRQMPCHYSFAEKRFVSISSVIGTQIIQAVGAAMAARIQKDHVVSVAFLGDGATSSNDFHSGMNLAGVMKAPVLFLCVNNQYAISLPVSKQTAAEALWKKGEAYGMPGVQVDGQDAIAIYRAVKTAADRARAGEGPTLIEVLTYRLDAHSSSDDASRYRDPAEAAPWRDPLAVMREHLQAFGLWDEAQEAALLARIQAELNEAVQQAQAASPPDWATLFQDVTAEPSPGLKRQYQELMQHESGMTLTGDGEFPL